MTVETATYIQDLEPTNPPGSDLIEEGDNHIRLIKTVLRTCFPNASRAIYDRRSTLLAANTVLTSAYDKRFILVNAAGAARTITLPALTSSNDGWSCIVMKSDGTINAVTVQASGGGQLLSQANVKLQSQYEFIELTWSGSAWYSTQRNWRQWLRTRAIDADATLTTDDFGCLIFAGDDTDNITLTLPNLTSFVGAVIGIQHAGAAGKKVTLDGAGAQQIDGENTYVMQNVGDTAWLVATSVGWFIFNFKSGSGFGPATQNTWTATQIFQLASLVEYEQTLTFAASVAWNLNLGNHAKITVTDDCTFAKPSNIRKGQRGLLRIVQDGNNDIAFNAVFEWISGQPEFPDDSVTILEYYCADTTLIYIWKAVGSGGYTDYDKGVPVAGSTYTQAHGLGAVPSDVQILLHPQTTVNGYTTDDYIRVDSAPVGDNDRGATISFNDTNAKVQIGSGGISLYPSGSGNAVVASLSSYHLIMRVFG